MSALPEHTCPCIEEGVVGLTNCIYLMLAVLTARDVVATCKLSGLRSLWETDVMEIRRCNCRGNRMHQPRQLTPPAYYGVFWTTSFTSLKTCLHVATTPAAAMPRLSTLKQIQENSIWVATLSVMHSWCNGMCWDKTQVRLPGIPGSLTL